MQVEIVNHAKALGDCLDTAAAVAYMAGIGCEELCQQLRRRYLTAALEDNGGNESRAARALGVHRNTLSRWLAELEISAGKIRLAERKQPYSDRAVRKLETKVARG